MVPSTSLHIYFIHAKHLQERQALMNNVRAALAKSFTVASVHVIEAMDPGEISVDLIQKIVDYTPIAAPDPLAFLTPLIKNIHINQLSNTLKHYQALQHIAKLATTDVALVLEDDVLFQDDLPQQLQTALELSLRQPGVTFLGLPIQGEAPPAPCLKPLAESYRILPINDAYMLTAPIAQRLLEHRQPVKFITNVQLQYMMAKAEIPAFQMSPPLFVDGSKYGVVTSMLSANNTLVFNGDYAALQTLLQKSGPLTEEDVTRIEHLLANSPIREHPDFKLLAGRFYVSEGRYAEAEKQFGEAYNTLVSKGCIVNHESALLKDFIQLFKHIQKLDA